MAFSVTHAKTNNITDWTQAQLDAQVALGNYPPGTLLADIALPSDWNNGHLFSGILPVANGGTGSSTTPYIKLDGTSTTTAEIPFAQGLMLDNTKKIEFFDSNAFINASSSGNLVVQGATSTTIGVAGDTFLGDSTLRTMYGNDLKMNIGDITHRINNFFCGIISATTGLGFFGTTPVLQQAAATDLGVTLSNYGLRVAGTTYTITTSGLIAFNNTADASATTAAVLLAGGLTSAKKIYANTSINVEANPSSSDNVSITPTTQTFTHNSGNTAALAFTGGTDLALVVSGGGSIGFKAANLTCTTLTSGRVPFATTGGKLIDSANLAYTSGTGLLVSDNIKLQTAGNGFYVKEGTNATMGVATLVGGTVTVSTTKVTANSRIFITAQSLGTVTIGQGLAISARSAGTSFTILSQSAVDTSVVAWIIMEPA